MIKKLLLSLVILIFLLLLIGWLVAPSIVAHRLAHTLHVPVDIERISLGWNAINAFDIKIGNPSPSVQPLAFTCKRLTSMAPFSHYFNHHIVIDEMILNDVYLDLEFKSATATKGNWTQLMKPLQKEMTAQKKPYSVLIRKLILNHIHVDVVYQKEKSTIKHLPTIDRLELTNLSSEGGLPMDQIMHSVLGQMLKTIFEKENLKNMMQNMMQLPIKPMQKLFTPFLAPDAVPPYNDPSHEKCYTSQKKF